MLRLTPLLGGSGCCIVAKKPFFPKISLFVSLSVSAVFKSRFTACGVRVSWGAVHVEWICLPCATANCSSGAPRSRAARRKGNSKTLQVRTITTKPKTYSGALLGRPVFPGGIKRVVG